MKHGPVGVIVTTMNEAFATAEKIVEDLHSGNVNESSSVDVSDVLRDKGTHTVKQDCYLLLRGQRFVKFYV